VYERGIVVADVKFIEHFAIVRQKNWLTRTKQFFEVGFSKLLLLVH
jgi:hypothetical protein